MDSTFGDKFKPDKSLLDASQGSMIENKSAFKRQAFIPFNDLIRNLAPPSLSSFSHYRHPKNPKRPHPFLNRTLRMNQSWRSLREKDFGSFKFDETFDDGMGKFSPVKNVISHAPDAYIKCPKPRQLLNLRLKSN